MTPTTKLPDFVRENVPMSHLTTFGIGGPARYLAEPKNRRELTQALELAAKLGVRVKPLGGGSNLLAADSGVDAMVLRLAAGGEFSEIIRGNGRDALWRVGAAVPLSSLVAAAARAGVAGLEGLAGIPGSVGGAAKMNCGSAGGCIGEFIAEVETVYVSGAFRTLRPPELRFLYRGSTLTGIAVNVAFHFREEGSPEQLLRDCRENRARKKVAQPLGFPSAGCVFKNPPGGSAGALLDMAGCKEMTEGGAMVSAIHANFIINQGGATARQVAVLAGRMREAVRLSAGIELEPEIDMWGDEPAFAQLKSD